MQIKTQQSVGPHLDPFNLSIIGTRRVYVFVFIVVVLIVVDLGYILSEKLFLDDFPESDESIEMLLNIFLKIFLSFVSNAF